MAKQIDIVEIAIEIKEISAYCKETYNEKDGDGMSQRITKLNGYLSRSAELLSSALFFLDSKKGRASDVLIRRYKDLAPTKLDKLILRHIAQEESVYKLCERINRTITHQIDSLRSQLSYIKEQYKKGGE